MSSLTIKQKKEWAKLLYIKENITQAEIAQRTGVSKVTLCKWVNSERWELEKASITITRQEQLARLYQQIAEINNAIANREAGKRFPTSSEADTINKIATAIDKLERETGLSDIISVSVELLDYLRKHDLAKAQEISAYFDMFIKDRTKQ